MKRIETIEEANIAHNDLSRWKDRVETNSWDRHRLRIVNNAPAKDDHDYAILAQLNPRIIFKIGIPAIGVNVTNRVFCEAEPGVRILRWRILANTAPSGGNDIFDIRKLEKNEIDFTLAESIFPPVNADKLVLPSGAIRAFGGKFHHSPFDFIYGEELIFDVLQIGAVAGTQVIVTLNTQLLGMK